MNDDAPLRSDWLGAFVCFAEHLNFTRAARALHLSQPALHVQISKLSEEVGVPLYVRRGRALELTREGTRLLAFGRESLERSRELRGQLRGEADEGPVSLCAGEGTYLYLLGNAIRTFSRRATVPLRLLTRNSTGTSDAVLSGEAHLGVAAIEPGGEREGLMALPLCDVQHVVVVPRTHPIARKRSLALTDLEGAALIVPPAGRPHRTMLSHALLTAGVSWQVAAEASGWELIVHFASLGLGLAIVNGFCRIPHGMVARPLAGLTPVRYSLLTRPGAHRGPNAERLRQLIVDNAGV